MKRFIVSVRDRAADTYGQPFYVTGLGQAIRSFTDEVNRAEKGNALFEHPEDFDLYEIGNFDDSSGVIERTEVRMICVGKDVKVRV